MQQLLRWHKLVAMLRYVLAVLVGRDRFRDVAARVGRKAAPALGCRSASFTVDSPCPIPGAGKGRNPGLQGQLLREPPTRRLVYLHVQTRICRPLLTPRDRSPIYRGGNGRDYRTILAVFLVRVVVSVVLHVASCSSAHAHAAGGRWSSGSPAGQCWSAGARPRSFGGSAPA